MHKALDLSQKVVVITGAAGLLGRQHAKVLAEVGAKLILVDIDLEGLEQLKSDLPQSTWCELYQLDLREEKQIYDCVTSLTAKLTADDELVLINNAAIDAKVTSDDTLNLTRLENFDIRQWDLEIEVGLSAAMLWCKHLGKVMAERECGVIINIASDLGVIAPNQELYKKPQLADEQQNVKPVTYSVIKHGLIGLTKYIATYWPDKGVRCNALAPGGIENAQPDEFLSKVQKLIPMGRMAKVDEYQGAILFLASDMSVYMNGHVMVVDGGRSVW